MKKVVFIIMLCTIFSGYSFYASAKNASISVDQAWEYAEDVMPHVFAALKSGDVKTLGKYMSNDMYQRYEVLLKQNKGYPVFLQKTYGSAAFSVKQVEVFKNFIRVRVNIFYPDTTQSQVAYFSLLPP